MEKGQLKVLKGNRLIDGNGEELTKNPVIIIEGSRIKEVGTQDKVKMPTNAEVIDMGKYTLMPGLMDLHTHLSGHNFLTFISYRVAQFEAPPPLMLLYTLLHAQMCFEMGYTTIRDHPWINSYGGHNTADLVAIRDAINNGIFAGPRLIVGGYAIITNSHLDLILPRSALRQPGFTADGPWELRKLARQQMRIGCDFIKTCASGGGATDKEEPDVRNMTQEELNAIVDEAHAFTKQCSCHCFTPAAQKMAVKAGIDTIEHCVFTDDEAIGMIKDANIPIIPTLAHRSDRTLEIRVMMGASEFVLNKMKRIQPYTKETFQRFYKAGLKIVMGTDLEIDPDMGANSMELEIYVKYGMSPMEAIQTATKNAAEALRMEKDIGTIGKGKYADIIAVDGNPLKDIHLLQERDKIKMVMKEGKIYVDKRPGYEKYVVHDQEWGWKRI